MCFTVESFSQSLYCVWSSVVPNLKHLMDPNYTDNAPPNRLSESILRLVGPYIIFENTEKRKYSSCFYWHHHQLRTVVKCELNYSTDITDPLEKYIICEMFIWIL